MSHAIDFLRDLSLLSVFVRLVLASICGGAIGLERAFKRRPAGFRTHILICLGAAMTTLTSQYLVLVKNYPTDIGRLGAQVVAGIGFIGAGTIIVTRTQRIKGLTTAAGMWASAIIGLAIGSGYYEVGVFATVLILLAELLFVRLEYALLDSAQDINVYLEYDEKSALASVFNLCKALNIRLLNMEYTHQSSTGQNAGMILSFRLNKECTVDEFLKHIQQIEYVTLAKLM